MVTTAATSNSSALDAITAKSNPATSSLDTASLSGTDGKAIADQNFDQFLILLTTQLKNQDPTEPLDTNQFVQELATLNQVQQQLETNKHLTDLVSATNQSKIDAGVGLIGKQIQANGNSGLLSGGNSSFIYELPQNADKVTVSISDAAGNVVFSGAGPKAAGKNLVTWGGTNSFTGKQEPDGEYHLSVKALDSEGNDITASSFTSGVVSSVEVAADGTAQLAIGSMRVPMNAVTSVMQAPNLSSGT